MSQKAIDMLIKASMLAAVFLAFIAVIGGVHRASDSDVSMAQTICEYEKVGCR